MTSNAKPEYNAQADLAGITEDTKVVQEYNWKKREIDKSTIDTKYQQIEAQKEEAMRLSSFDVTANRDEIVAKLGTEISEYLHLAKEGTVFLNDSFLGMIPYFARNIILAAAETGSGKSTITSNLGRNAADQGKNVLILTNEENPGDLYNRISCLGQGFAYTNIETFSTEKISKLVESMKVLANQITIIGDAHEGMTGCTTTIEGFEMIFKSLVRDMHKKKFDVIIIDYYQNVDRSVKNSNLADWQVQGRLGKLLDQFKNIYPAPIVLLAQKKKSNGETNLDFKNAIEGRKSILNVVTCALDVKVNYERSSTSFTIEKSRFNGCIGKTIEVGFDRGKYIPYTKDFAIKVMQDNLAKIHSAALSGVTLTNSKGD
jgi:hypothetical protein